MNEIVLYLTKTKKNHLRYKFIKNIEDMDVPIEYNDTKLLKNVDSIKEKWEIQKVTKTGEGDREKLIIDFKLLLRKIKKV